MPQDHKTIYIFSTKDLNAGIFKDSIVKENLKGSLFTFHNGFAPEIIDNISFDDIKDFKDDLIKISEKLNKYFNESDLDVIKDTLKDDENKEKCKTIIEYLSKDYLKIHQIKGLPIYAIQPLKEDHPGYKKNNESYVYSIIKDVFTVFELYENKYESIKIILHGKDTAYGSSKFYDIKDEEDRKIYECLTKNLIKIDPSFKLPEIFLFNHISGQDLIYKIIEWEEKDKLIERLEKSLDNLKISDEEIISFISKCEILSTFSNIKKQTNNGSLKKIAENLESCENFAQFLEKLFKSLDFRKLNKSYSDFYIYSNGTLELQGKQKIKYSYSENALNCFDPNSFSSELKNILNISYRQKRLILFLSVVDFQRKNFKGILDLIVDDTYNKNTYTKLLIVCTHDYLNDTKYSKVLESFVNINRAWKFFDSNIWIRFLAIDQSNNNSEIERQKPGIYKTSIAKEYIEFQTRIFKQSYLDDSESHGTHISPFVFHSETKMKNDADKLINEVLNKSIEWNFLLVDDYADDYLAQSSLEDKDESLTKRNIINSLLKRENKETHMHVTSVYSTEETNNDLIWKSLIKLSEKTYDIILLDYLLGKRTGSNNQREYSDELLNIISKICDREKGYHIEGNYSELKKYIPEKDWTKIDKVVNGIFYHKGPLNKFWVLNTSTFHTAFLDRLREQGLGHNSEHWYLSRGADPVNTPELFRYSLYKLIELQIKEVAFTKEDISEHFKRHFNLEIKDIRAWAKSYYQIFISKYGKIHVLNNDQSSCLSKTYCKYFIENNNVDLIFYEKMRNFMFLMAYGSANDSGQLQMSYTEILAGLNWGDGEIDRKKEDRLIKYINTLNSRLYN